MLAFYDKDFSVRAKLIKLENCNFELEMRRLRITDFLLWYRNLNTCNTTLYSINVFFIVEGAGNILSTHLPLSNVRIFVFLLLYNTVTSFFMYVTRFMFLFFFVSFNNWNYHIVPISYGSYFQKIIKTYVLIKD